MAALQVPISASPNSRKAGGALPIRVEILGEDLDQIAAATDEVVERMTALGGFVDIADNRPLPGLEWTLVTDREAASRHGVDLGPGTMIKMLTRGVRISDFRPDDADDELDVVMRFMGDQRNIDRLRELRVRRGRVLYPAVCVRDITAKAERRGYRTAGRHPLHVYQL